MHRVIKATKHALPDIEGILREIRNNVNGSGHVVRLIDYDDEVVIWTVDGRRCSLNFKEMDPVDVEREIYDKTESKLEGVSYED